MIEDLFPPPTTFCSDCIVTMLGGKNSVTTNKRQVKNVIRKEKQKRAKKLEEEPEQYVSFKDVYAEEDQFISLW